MHLMPSSAERTREAIHAVFGPAGASADGTYMAQIGD
jgi:hypothetical protein